MGVIGNIRAGLRRRKTTKDLAEHARSYAEGTKKMRDAKGTTRESMLERAASIHLGRSVVKTPKKKLKPARRMLGR